MPHLPSFATALSVRLARAALKRRFVPSYRNALCDAPRCESRTLYEAPVNSADIRWSTLRVSASYVQRLARGGIAIQGEVTVVL